MVKLRDRTTLNDEEFKFSSDWQNRSSFDEDQLVATIRDLYVAGTETTATTMTWILLFLSKHPEKQKKMQQEIDEVLGQAGVPKMAMMDKLPYLKAVIQVRNYSCKDATQVKISIFWL